MLSSRRASFRTLLHAKGGLAMVRIKVRDLRPGDRVGRTVYNLEGVILLQPDTPLTPVLIDLLKEHHITGLWIEDDVVPDLHVADPIRHETKEGAKIALGAVYERIKRGRPPMEAEMASLVKSVRELVMDVMEADGPLLSLTHLRSWDDYTLEQPVQTAIVATAIGKKMNLAFSRLLRLGLGAILHDIGMLALPDELLARQGPLNSEAYAAVQAHTTVGWNWVHDFMSIPPTSSITVLQHHERFDGSGYPRGISGSKVYELSWITAVADAFVAMRSDRPYRPRLTPKEVLETLRGESKAAFDPDAVKALLSSVALVPDGEIVRLTDGSLGAVVEQVEGSPLGPKVAIVRKGPRRLSRREVSLGDGPPLVDAILDAWPPSYRGRPDPKEAQASREHAG